MAKPTVWETERDAKKLAKSAKIGDVLYTIDNVARNVARYEDSQLYSRHVVEHYHPITGTPMVAGSLSVTGLVKRFGPVYSERPNLRGVHEPVPQVAGPVDRDEIHILDEAELKALEKRAGDAARVRNKSRWSTIR